LPAKHGQAILKVKAAKVNLDVASGRDVKGESNDSKEDNAEIGNNRQDVSGIN